jgi:deoxyribose-phosphate aldolase
MNIPLGKAKLAKLIDHTLLKAGVVRAEIVKLCAEGRQLGFASVCVNPIWVPLAVELLCNSDVKVDTVIGFPLGATLQKVKVFEMETVIAAGAEEVDVVMNIGSLKSGNNDLVRKELAAIVEVTEHEGVISKIIIETCYLTHLEKIRACKLVSDSGADFVKTSTGFGSNGATVDDVQLLRKVSRCDMGVKAAGGIRTYVDVLAMIEAGASRIGSSSGVHILETCPESNY